MSHPTNDSTPSSGTRELDLSTDVSTDLDRFDESHRTDRRKLLSERRQETKGARLLQPSPELCIAPPPDVAEGLVTMLRLFRCWDERRRCLSPSLASRGPAISDSDFWRGSIGVPLTEYWDRILSLSTDVSETHTNITTSPSDKLLPRVSPTANFRLRCATRLHGVSTGLHALLSWQYKCVSSMNRSSRFPSFAPAHQHIHTNMHTSAPSNPIEQMVTSMLTQISSGLTAVFDNTAGNNEGFYYDVPPSPQNIHRWPKNAFPPPDWLLNLLFMWRYVHIYEYLWWFTDERKRTAIAHREGLLQEMKRCVHDVMFEKHSNNGGGTANGGGGGGGTGNGGGNDEMLPSVSLLNRPSQSQVHHADIESNPSSQARSRSHRSLSQQVEASATHRDSLSMSMSVSLNGFLDEPNAWSGGCEVNDGTSRDSEKQNVFFGACKVHPGWSGVDRALGEASIIRQEEQSLIGDDETDGFDKHGSADDTDFTWLSSAEEPVVINMPVSPKARMNNRQERDEITQTQCSCGSQIPLNVQDVLHIADRNGDINATSEGNGVVSMFGYTMDRVKSMWPFGSAGNEAKYPNLRQRLHENNPEWRAVMAEVLTWDHKTAHCVVTRNTYDLCVRCRRAYVNTAGFMFQRCRFCVPFLYLSQFSANHDASNNSTSPQDVNSNDNGPSEGHENSEKVNSLLLQLNQHMASLVPCVCVHADAETFTSTRRKQLWNVVALMSTPAITIRREVYVKLTRGLLAKYVTQLGAGVRYPRDINGFSDLIRVLLRNALFHPFVAQWSLSACVINNVNTASDTSDRWTLLSPLYWVLGSSHQPLSNQLTNTPSTSSSTTLYGGTNGCTLSLFLALVLMAMVVSQENERQEKNSAGMSLSMQFMRRLMLDLWQNNNNNNNNNSNNNSSNNNNNSDVKKDSTLDSTEKKRKSSPRNAFMLFYTSLPNLLPRIPALLRDVHETRELKAVPLHVQLCVMLLYNIYCGASPDMLRWIFSARKAGGGRATSIIIRRICDWVNIATAIKSREQFQKTESNTVDLVPSLRSFVYTSLCILLKLTTQKRFANFLCVQKAPIVPSEKASAVFCAAARTGPYVVTTVIGFLVHQLHDLVQAYCGSLRQSIQLQPERSSHRQERKGGAKDESGGTPGDNSSQVSSRASWVRVNPAIIISTCISVINNLSPYLNVAAQPVGGKYGEASLLTWKVCNTIIKSLRITAYVLYKTQKPTENGNSSSESKQSPRSKPDNISQAIMLRARQFRNVWDRLANKMIKIKMKYQSTKQKLDSTVKIIEQTTSDKEKKSNQKLANKLVERINRIKRLHKRAKELFQNRCDLHSTVREIIICLLHLVHTMTCPPYEKTKLNNNVDHRMTKNKAAHFMRNSVLLYSLCSHMDSSSVSVFDFVGTSFELEVGNQSSLQSIDDDKQLDCDYPQNKNWWTILAMYDSDTFMYGADIDLHAQRIYDSYYELVSGIDRRQKSEFECDDVELQIESSLNRKVPPLQFFTYALKKLAQKPLKVRQHVPPLPRYSYQPAKQSQKFYELYLRQMWVEMELFGRV